MGLGSRGLAVHSPLVGPPEMRFFVSCSKKSSETGGRPNDSLQIHAPS